MKGLSALLCFGFALAQPLNVPPADTQNILFVTVFDKTVGDVQLGDSTHLILELSQRDPESFYKYEHWHYEQNDQRQYLTRNAEVQVLDEARLEWLEKHLQQAYSLKDEPPHFLNYDYFNDKNRWFFASDKDSFRSLAVWQEGALLQSWYADPGIDGMDGYSQNDARLDTLLTRHFAAHQLLPGGTIQDFASELPEYFELSEDMELGLLLASQSLEAAIALEIWREVQHFPARMEE
jgi:hypothetical protein